jgi:hypothetical protein
MGRPLSDICKGALMTIAYNKIRVIKKVYL